MAFKDSLNEALAKYLRDNVALDVVEVLEFEDKTIYGGYCETCAYEEVVAVITYKDSTGDTREYQYYSSFANLIRNLTD